MNECFGRYFILNGELMPAEQFDPSLVYEGESLYEVLRLVRGVPLFFYDHISRLESGARYQKRDILSDAEGLKKHLKLLQSSEKKMEVNLKIVFNYNNGKNNLILYYLEPVYPSPTQYSDGVKGILYFAERKDPESKVINHKLRSEIFQRLIMENAYEALLVNRHNCVTEGSRSNIFFIREDRLYTAPDKEVLSGITRMYLIDICREKGLKLEFECVTADRLAEFESAFMSGTSPIVLPFCSIGDVRFNVNHSYIKLLRDLYLEKARESMRRYAE